MMLSLRRKWIRSLATATATATAVATASAALLVPNAQATQAATSQCSWMDTSKSADERASELIAAMTLDQKIAEL
ncbi:MAG: hypothetical protein JWP76_6076, partial [Dactylosporangium sp.]|nr:hypothetical protein [Dactylosporangium sp.]